MIMPTESCYNTEKATKKHPCAPLPLTFCRRYQYTLSFELPRAFTEVLFQETLVCFIWESGDKQLQLLLFLLGFTVDKSIYMNLIRHHISAEENVRNHMIPAAPKCYWHHAFCVGDQQGKTLAGLLSTEINLILIFSSGFW